MDKLEINLNSSNYEDYSIEKEINKGTVRNTVVRQVDDMEYPAVCINCAKHSNMNRFALEGLRCLIASCSKVEDDSSITDNSDESDIVPVYINTKTGVLEVGRASFIKLSRYLCDFVSNCISDKVKVYYMESRESTEPMNKADKYRVILDL